MKALVAILGSVTVLLLLLFIAIVLLNDLWLRLRRWARRRLSREQRRVIEQFRVKLNPHKLERKRSVRSRLLTDPVLRADLEAHARSTGESLSLLLERVDDYADEIIPFFNVVSYYRVGYTLAALLIRALYWSRVDPDEVDRVRAFLDDARERGDAVVFLMNHRSNADFVLVAYVLARAIALSYAVGEWARVWPLEGLFKSFGSYFVRRGCRDPVYHMTLRRYLQIITEEGVTQGIFLEGGLSRDGALRPAKIGLIDSITTRPRLSGGRRAKGIVFVPVGINYDRVLEDEVLTRETEGAAGMGSGASYYVSAAVRVARYLFASLPRYVARRVRKFGYAAVCFGEPIALESLLDPAARRDLASLDRDARKPILQAAADRLLLAIADVVPATPVALVSSAILGEVADEAAEDAHVTEGELRDRLSRLAEDLARSGVSVVGLERGVQHIERVGITILETRGHVERVGGVIVTRPDRRHLLRYYRNAIRRHLERVEASRRVSDELGILGTMPPKEDRVADDGPVRS